MSTRQERLRRLGGLEASGAGANNPSAVASRPEHPAALPPARRQQPWRRRRRAKRLCRASQLFVPESGQSETPKRRTRTANAHRRRGLSLTHTHSPRRRVDSAANAASYTAIERGRFRDSGRSKRRTPYGESARRASLVAAGFAMATRVRVAALRRGGSCAKSSCFSCPCSCLAPDQRLTLAPLAPRAPAVEAQPQEARPRVRGPRARGQAPEAPVRPWQCWRSAPPPHQHGQVPPRLLRQGGAAGRRSAGGAAAAAAWRPGLLPRF